MSLRFALRLASRVGAWTLALAPLVSLLAMAFAGAASGALRSPRVLILGLGAFGLVFAIAALAPSSHWPWSPPPTLGAITANLLTAGAIANPGAPASWRLQEARFLGRDALGPGTGLCFEVAAAGRVFMVAPWSAGPEPGPVTAAARVTHLSPAGEDVAELRLAAHGTGQGGSVRFGGAAPGVVSLELDGARLASPSGRFVLALRNVSAQPLQLCLADAGTWLGAHAGFPEATTGGTALVQPRYGLAAGAYAATLVALVALATLGWRAAWRDHRGEITLAMRANVVVLLVLAIVLYAGPTGLLAGWLPHRNFVAAQLGALALLVALPLRDRWVGALAVGASMVAAAALGAQAALVGVVAGAALGWVRYRSRVMVGAVIVALLMAGFAWAALTGRDAARMDVFEGAWASVIDRPWSGYGFGSSIDALRSALPDHPTLFGHAHNVLLELALQFGLPGALLVLAVVLATWIAALRRSAPAAAGWMVLLTSSAVDVTLLVATGAATAAMLTGFALGPVPGTRHSSPRESIEA